MGLPLIMKRNTFFAVLTGALLFSACSEAPKESKKETAPPPPPEPISGQSAFFKMYTAARGWAQDCEGLQMRSIQLPQVKAEPGKAGAWEATFVSTRLSRARRYTWSAVEAEGNLHKGVFALNDEGWSGPRGATRSFSFQALKIDTTAAFETALKKGKGAAEYVKKNPGKTVQFLLELTPNRFPDLTWRVIWGESASSSNYSVFVDASTGQYLETMR